MEWPCIAVRGPPTRDPELRYLGPQQPLNLAHGSDGRDIEAVARRRLHRGTPCGEPRPDNGKRSRRGTEPLSNLTWWQEVPELTIARCGDSPSCRRHTPGVTRAQHHQQMNGRVTGCGTLNPGPPRYLRHSRHDSITCPPTRSGGPASRLGGSGRRSHCRRHATQQADNRTDTDQARSTSHGSYPPAPPAQFHTEASHRDGFRVT
jgi:hypothetical protein